LCKILPWHCDNLFFFVMSTLFHCASPLFASLNFLYYLQCQSSLFAMHPIVHFLVCNVSICAQFCYHITLFSFTRVHLYTYIFFVHVCFVMLWRSDEAMDLCWWNDGSLLFYHPSFWMDRVLQMIAMKM